MSKVLSFLAKKNQALEWIESALEIKIEDSKKKDFIELLKDGVLLCKLMQSISPRLMPRISVPDPNSTRKATFVHISSENISFFIQACADMGVPRHKRFNISDIVIPPPNRPTFTNIKRIIECLESICKIANSDPSYAFTTDWPETSPDQVFSEEEISNAEQMLAQFTIRENKRQEVIKKTQVQSDGGIEETKTRLFQHLADQKKLYPDNNPQKSPGGSNRNSLSSPIKVQPNSSPILSSSAPVNKVVPGTTTTSTTSNSTPTTPTISSTTSTNASVLSKPATPSTTTTTTTTTVTSSPKTPSQPKLSVEERAAIRIQKAVKRWLERNRQRVLARDAAYRERIVQEIQKTEIEYLTRLTFLKDFVIKELRDAINVKGSPIISEEELKIIFSEIEIVLAYNTILKTELNNRVEKWDQNTCIGDIFIKFSAFLKVYSQYSRNYTEAMNLLNTLKTQSKFKAFLQKIKDQNEEIKLRGLEDYLIRPIQRIPRYSLLLKDMISHTWQTHPDYPQLVKAFELINQVAEFMNDKKKEAENMMKLAEIQEKLSDETLSKSSWSSRRFVREGEFFEFVSKTKKNPIVVYLFNDSISISRSSKSSSSSFFGKQKTIRLQAAFTFLLNKMEMEENEKITGLPSLKLYQKGEKSVSIIFSDNQQMEEWKKEIKTVKDEETIRVKDNTERVANSVSSTDGFAQNKSDIEGFVDKILKKPETKVDTENDPSAKKMSLRENRMKLAQDLRNRRLSANVGSNSSSDFNAEKSLSDSKN